MINTRLVQQCLSKKEPRKNVMLNYDIPVKYQKAIVTTIVSILEIVIVVKYCCLVPSFDESSSFDITFVYSYFFFRLKILLLF